MLGLDPSMTETSILWSRESRVTTKTCFARNQTVIPAVAKRSAGIHRRAQALSDGSRICAARVACPGWRSGSVQDRQALSAR